MRRVAPRSSLGTSHSLFATRTSTPKLRNSPIALVLCGKRNEHASRDQRPPPGKHIEAVEIELLSDVEGSSELENMEYRMDRPEERWMQNIWSGANLAVVMSYFCVGFGMRFLTTPISYYMVANLGES